MYKRKTFIYIVLSEIIIEAIMIGVIYLSNVKLLNNEKFGKKDFDKQHLVKIMNEKVKEGDKDEEKDYIKWVDFKVTERALNRAYLLDKESIEKEVHLNWIELLAYLGCKYGGDFKKYKDKDMEEIVNNLNEGNKMSDITREMKYYNYYYEAYEAVLGGMIGWYKIEVEDNLYERKYGLKAFFPLAKNYPFSHYDDFGVSREYGYRRRHLGHDLMGAVGTPVIAVESGEVEALGWNRYGGWRIGIRSFDKKRYYYYAHLRKNFPYNKSLKIGSKVVAGDVIGYMGRTGYSSKENVNNIDTSHLHFGIQLIFDESQKEGIHEIWIDCYEIVKFLYKNRSETIKDIETKEYSRIRKMIEEKNK